MSDNKCLCDGCSKTTLPQTYVGQGIMLCPECLAEHNKIFKPIPSEAPPDGVKDQNVREMMNKIGHLVDEELPDGWGFFVMAFPFEKGEGRMNYVSNGKREHILELMRDFIKKGGPTFKHT